MPHRYECLLGSQPLIIETGAIANQADGAVTVRYGDTLILATVCVSKEEREDADMVPLTVDYEEKHYHKELEALINRTYPQHTELNAAGYKPLGFDQRDEDEEEEEEDEEEEDDDEEEEDIDMAD